MPPENVEVAVEESLMMTEEFKTPPVMVRPFELARPPEPTDNPPVYVDVPVPCAVKKPPVVMLPVAWRVEEALRTPPTERMLARFVLPPICAVLEALRTAVPTRLRGLSEILKEPAMDEEALETKPLLKWKARLSEADDEAV